MFVFYLRFVFMSGSISDIFMLGFVHVLQFVYDDFIIYMVVLVIMFKLSRQTS